jgi:hypothetical protein
VLQVAPFHPRFQFDGTEPDDITNATNRAPYPTLHLIREDSIDRAVAAFPEAETIFEANMATMRGLGPDGWAALDVGAARRPRRAAGDMNQNAQKESCQSSPVHAGKPKTSGRRGARASCAPASPSSC